MERTRAISRHDALLASAARVVAHLAVARASDVRAAGFETAVARTHAARAAIGRIVAFHALVRARVASAAAWTVSRVRAGGNRHTSMRPTALPDRAVRVRGALEALVELQVANRVDGSRTGRRIQTRNPRHAAARRATLPGRALRIESALATAELRVAMQTRRAIPVRGAGPRLARTARSATQRECDRAPSRHKYPRKRSHSIRSSQQVLERAIQNRIPRSRQAELGGRTSLSSITHRVKKLSGEASAAAARTWEPIQIAEARGSVGRAKDLAEKMRLAIRWAA